MSKVRIFPVVPVRAWVVIQVDDGFCGIFRGERDPADEGPDHTATGPLHLVVGALLKPNVRQGLPIVPHENPFWLTGAVA